MAFALQCGQWTSLLCRRNSCLSFSFVLQDRFVSVSILFSSENLGLELDNVGLDDRMSSMPKLDQTVEVKVSFFQKNFLKIENVG